ncbi:HTH-type transcriptional activator RamA [Actinomadura sp. RB99]|uniref:LuxR C-terminal-related transcriptional regulator n=1 Tax=Actinomadura sp. RB99 TaxID=2691577 RepID=UPI0016839857|nr:LuxR C-terminal-related transcriptional regulator [Actinomadura sp. RB99]MBD2892579.1 HTH-type transcriptional activator RamA [Actinomadura sp. RB99]
MNRPETTDEPQIHRALARLRDMTSLPLAFGGPVNAARQVRFTQFAGATTGALRGVAVDCGLGLGGKVVARRRPIVVNDYVASSGISHQYDHVITAEGLRAMVAVPVIVGRTVRAVLYCTTRTTFPLGDRVVQAALETARDLEQNLAVRDRAARGADRLGRQEPGGTAPTAEQEVVREAYAELRVLAQGLDDDALRQRLEQVCAKLCGAGAAPSAPQAVPYLSARELDVLACVALGWTNTQVAADLGVTTETVKSYLRNATRKLHVRTRLEAVVAARRYGLLP